MKFLLFTVIQFVHITYEVNDETPIEIKLLVLDNCIFSLILYAVGTWGDIGYTEQKRRLIEQKALKAVLKVKKGTSTDI